MRKSPSVVVLTEAGFHPTLLLKPLDDLLEIRGVAFLIGSRVPLGERRYGRTSVLRDTYQATIASTARTAVPKLNVVIDGSIIRYHPSALPASKRPSLPRGPDKKRQQHLLRTLAARERRQRLTILENPTPPHHAAISSRTDTAFDCCSSRYLGCSEHLSRSRLLLQPCSQAPLRSTQIRLRLRRHRSQL
jgi:hypothetical protein